MDVLHHDFHEDDAYSRDCTAFKVSLGSFTLINGFFKGEINKISDICPQRLADFMSYMS